MNYDEELVEGIFIEESKNRFLCTVKINGVPCECYVPSSSRIENYLKLKNKVVLLTINKAGKRTKYSLFAVQYYNGYILLNLNLVNRIVESLISHNMLKQLNGFSIQREQVVDSYKTDLLLTNRYNEKIIVEVKGIISSKKEANFPSVFSERAISQLILIKDMLLKGYKIFYLIVSLSPVVNKIKLDDKYSEYTSLLKECISLGMNLLAFSLKFEDNTIKYNGRIKINQ
ncbi:MULTISPECIES: DNA/RNA nuclease SfsA [Brevibacillus]|uniref:DNA/RNA nuclease SfsA n=1 Tax=Brevibacillus TaxID=55080 RepID=UPI000D0F61EC|nr:MULTISPECIES: DNA/RNA nuclease SfsA [Brevibacillus]MED1947216.1 DNA/RNA nuclease SfsA [Brevibacillus formosus]MED1997517.1 DNA/RNA nuclease SfsA [Brevibacillus formosus]MED2083374.1 DNA/RNA nuclease SfsA [Brevibacillus formosus]PSK16808.1 hypothetical protein C7R94_15940 [Brevibacillus sp. NRRL NRS-603]